MKSSSLSRKDSKEQTRQRLIKAVLQLTIDKGLAGLTMNQIAREAGIAQPSFYNHYASLPDLFRDVRLQMAERYLTPLRQKFIQLMESWKAGEQTIQQVFRAYLEFHVDILLSNIQLFKALLADYHDRSSPVQGELGLLLDEIHSAWCDFFVSLLSQHNIEITEEQLMISVDSMAALVHQLVLGCDKKMYCRERVIDMLAMFAENIFSDTSRRLI